MPNEWNKLNGDKIIRSFAKNFQTFVSSNAWNNWLTEIRLSYPLCSSESSLVIRLMVTLVHDASMILHTCNEGHVAGYRETSKWYLAGLILSQFPSLIMSIIMGCDILKGEGVHQCRVGTVNRLTD